MTEILPVTPKLTRKLKRLMLTAKFQKQLALLTDNPKHPGLNCELLEPKKHGIYSFRVNKKYRALFIYRPDQTAIEILGITHHYQ